MIDHLAQDNFPMDEQSSIPAQTGVSQHRPSIFVSDLQRTIDSTDLPTMIYLYENMDTVQRTRFALECSGHGIDIRKIVDENLEKLDDRITLSPIHQGIKLIGQMDGPKQNETDYVYDIMDLYSEEDRKLKNYLSSENNVIKVYLNNSLDGTSNDDQGSQDDDMANTSIQETEDESMIEERPGPSTSKRTRISETPQENAYTPRSPNYSHGSKPPLIRPATLNYGTGDGVHQDFDLRQVLEAKTVARKKRQLDETDPMPPLVYDTMDMKIVVESKKYLRDIGYKKSFILMKTHQEHVDFRQIRDGKIYSYAVNALCIDTFTQFVCENFSLPNLQAQFEVMEVPNIDRIICTPKTNFSCHYNEYAAINHDIAKKFSQHDVIMFEFR